MDSIILLVKVVPNEWQCKLMPDGELNNTE